MPRWLTTLLWLALPTLTVGLVQAADSPHGRRGAVVLELFTSQGCSSCPTADALLRDYARRPDVVALSLPVDYWDYLGWKDTLANPKFTSRQRAYADERGDGRVYTPQVVVNGLVHVVGGRKDEIERAIAQTSAKLAADRIEVVARSDGKAVTVETGPIPQASAMTGGTIWLAAVQPSVKVEIKRGENRGKTVAYANVVRDLTPIGMWSAKAARFELPETAVLQQGQRGAVLLQEGTVGAIVGASWVIGPEH